MTRIAALLVLAAALACAGAVRMPANAFMSSETATQGFQKSAQSVLGLMRDLGRGRRKAECRAYAVVRFIVPPGEASSFEDAWLDLEKDVLAEEKEVEIFDLKKTTLDNLIYISYGEWTTMRGLHKYLTADHFKRFAEFVDNRGVRWQLEVLKSLSSDLEEEEEHKILKRGHGQQPEQDQQDQQGQGDWDKYVPEGTIPDEYRPGGGKQKKEKGCGCHCCHCHHSRKCELSHTTLAEMANGGLDAEESLVVSAWREVHRRKNMHHVLITYIIPPGEGEGFVDAWYDAAKETVREKGNRIYSLRKVATDNTRYYVYGTWDSMSDYLDHYESKHVRRLIDHTMDNDIVWFIEPLIKIGNEPE